MNYRLVSKYLGVVCLLISAAMIFSLPWALGALGYRSFDGELLLANQADCEREGFFGLLLGIVVSLTLGIVLFYLGKQDTSDDRVYRKEAMAAVGLSWVLATMLGAIPFMVAGVKYTPKIRLDGQDNPPRLMTSGMAWRAQWSTPSEQPNGGRLEEQEYRLLEILLKSADGRTSTQLVADTGIENAAEILRQLAQQADWQGLLVIPDNPTPHPRRYRDRIRVQWARMGLIDSLFESQSGFSTTGATILSDLEDPRLVPHCILFWRSTTHFLGGLGIIVLFVVILGEGSAGKVLMQAEMPGPTKEGSMARMQQTAWVFAAIYVALNLLLTVVLLILGMTTFDAFCHAFGTMATGGFSTYNTSVGFFQSASIDYVITLFMILAGTNFTLLYFLLLRRPGMLLVDIEWRTYIGLIVLVTGLIMVIGIPSGDFDVEQPLVREAGGAVENANGTLGAVGRSLQQSLFQVVAIITTTGYGTADFDNWNNFARIALLMLMFVGGCAGSTGGGMKVIRHILFVKILRLEIEQAYRPSVVRPLTMGGQPVEDQGLRKSIMVYFGLVLLIFCLSWVFIVTVEPDLTWSVEQRGNKLIDSGTAVVATLNNIGPGLGIVGSTQNYSMFSPLSKLLFTWLMMLGRLELFSILVLTSVSFWRNR